MRSFTCVRVRSLKSHNTSASVLIRACTSESVPIRVRSCMYVCIRAHTSASVRLRLRSCVRLCSFAFIQLKVQTRLHALSAMRLDEFFAQGPSTCTIYRHSLTHAHTRTHVRTHTHTHTNTNTHTQTHTYSRMHTHAPSPCPSCVSCVGTAVGMEV